MRINTNDMLALASLTFMIAVIVALDTIIELLRQRQTVLFQLPTPPDMIEAEGTHSFSEEAPASVSS